MPFTHRRFLSWPAPGQRRPESSAGVQGEAGLLDVSPPPLSRA